MSSNVQPAAVPVVDRGELLAECLSEIQQAQAVERTPEGDLVISTHYLLPDHRRIAVRLTTDDQGVQVDDMGAALAVALGGHAADSPEAQATRATLEAEVERLGGTLGVSMVDGMVYARVDDSLHCVDLFIGVARAVDVIVRKLAGQAGAVA
jgi:hypothetical protein